MTRRDRLEAKLGKRAEWAAKAQARSEAARGAAESGRAYMRDVVLEGRERARVKSLAVDPSTTARSARSARIAELWDRWVVRNGEVQAAYAERAPALDPLTLISQACPDCKKTMETHDAIEVKPCPRHAKLLDELGAN